MYFAGIGFESSNEITSTPSTEVVIQQAHELSEKVSGVGYQASGTVVHTSCSEGSCLHVSISPNVYDASLAHLCGHDFFVYISTVYK